MGAFQKHCVFGFRQGVLPRPDHAMGHFGRITRPADLPDDTVLLDLIGKAVRLNDADLELSSRIRRWRRTSR